MKLLSCFVIDNFEDFGAAIPVVAVALAVVAVGVLGSSRVFQAAVPAVAFDLAVLTLMLVDFKSIGIMRDVAHFFIGLNRFQLNP